MTQLTNWNVKYRSQSIQKMQTGEFDLLIIGGGITGAGVAREAALRGLSFCLIDKNDFASGTSSRSSKLAHGGLRYLSYGDFKLVRLSTTERNWLRIHFPNLVRPAAFITNSYKNTKDSSFTIRLGMFLYKLLSDTFSKFKNFKKPVFIKPKDMKGFEPNILKEGLKISALYYDTNVDDSRLTVETIKEALEISGGKSTAVNYVQAVNFLQNVKGKIYGITAKNNLTGQRFTVRGKVLVNASGIWTDEVLSLAGIKNNMTRPTKGVHVVVPNSRIGNKNAVGLRSIDDGRFYFILHRGEVSVIGTTDTDYRGSLDNPFCDKSDCDYLFHTVNHIFPNAHLTYNDIISTYAGIRPLILEKGKSASSVSRRHVIADTGMNLISIAGGKLTEFRKMAEDLIFFLAKKKYLKPFRGKASRKNFSKTPYRVGLTAEDFNKSIMEEKLAQYASFEQLKHLHQQYGRNAISILRNIKQDQRKAAPLLAGYPFCRAEIEFLLENESIVTLTDMMCRRTEMQMTVWHTKQKELASQVAEIMAEFVLWSAEKKNQEIKNYMNLVDQSVRFINPKKNNPAGPAHFNKPHPGRNFGRPRRP